jgi:peptidoglycan hydrolase CwlO-like protein
MELDQWLEAFENFPELEAKDQIQKMEEEIVRLQSEAQELQSRITALKSLISGRQLLRGLVTGAFASGATGPAGPTGPTLGSVVSRSSIGTSQAILDLMRTSPESLWGISDILQGLEARSQLPNSQDPRRAVDATLHRLTNVTEQIERMDRGVYRLVNSDQEKEVRSVAE